MLKIMLCFLYSSQSITSLAENATRNGILTFILGTLFVLSVYHFLLFFQNNSRTYLYYSIYTFLIFLAYITKVETGFLKDFVSAIGINNDYSDFYRWTYNCVYFVFAVRFLNIKNTNKQWFKYIIYPIIAIYSLAIIAQFSVLISNNYTFYNFYSSCYLPIITLHTIFSFWFIFRLKGYLKYYIIIGAIILFVTSIIGEYSIRTLPFINISAATGDFIFYVGFLIENICFSLGLGHKQKLILKERNDANKELLSKLTENEALKEEVNQQLQEKIEALNNQITFKQEISDLKLSALRNQMNPHFIFNSLNSIKLYIINNEKENAVYYLNKFAKLIRKILEASKEKEISITEELETSALYMKIENIRFSNSIDFVIHVDESINTDRIKIPSLILQPFLENALWHGLSSKNGDKKIVLSVKFKDEKFVQIIVEDNGIGRKAANKLNEGKHTKQKSIGIWLTKERLTNFYKDYNDRYSIDMEDLYSSKNEACGTKIVLNIPIKKHVLKTA